MVLLVVVIRTSKLLEIAICHNLSICNVNPGPYPCQLLCSSFGGSLMLACLGSFKTLTGKVQRVFPLGWREELSVM